jgi:hypothetical protein
LACNHCTKNKPIVNLKYGICSNCNSIRLTGKSLTERQADSSQKYLNKAKERFRNKVREETDLQISPKIYPIRRSAKPIRQQTKKEAGIKSQLSAVKKDIELEAVQNNEYFCKGCGKSHVGLDKSHILSVGQYKQYELFKANMQLMCRDCHKIWESGTIEEQMGLLCFVDNLQFIFTLEPLVHQKFITRIEEYRVWLIAGKDKERISGINEILNQVRV